MCVFERVPRKRKLKMILNSTTGLFLHKYGLFYLVSKKHYFVPDLNETQNFHLKSLAKKMYS